MKRQVALRVCTGRAYITAASTPELNCQTHEELLSVLKEHGQTLFDGMKYPVERGTVDAIGRFYKLSH